jgi:hypothetical protein
LHTGYGADLCGVEEEDVGVFVWVAFQEGKKKKEKVRWSVVSFFVGGGCSVLDITNEHGRASGHGTGVKGCKGRARTGAHEEGADIHIYMNKH